MRVCREATLQIKYKMRKLQIRGWRDSVHEHIFVVTKSLKTEQCFWLYKKANTYFTKYFHLSIKILNINSVAVFDLLRQTFTFIPKVFLNLNKVGYPLVEKRNVIETYFGVQMYSETVITVQMDTEIINLDLKMSQMVAL